MHTFDLGLLLELHGSTLDELVYDDPDRSSGKAEDRAKDLWQEIQKVYREQKVSSCLDHFRISDFHDPQHFCRMSCKAANARHLLPVLYEVLKRRSGNSPRDKHRLRAYKLLNHCYQLMMTSGMFLDLETWKEVETTFDQFMLEYNWLTKHSFDNNVLRYNFTFKMHMAWHIIQFARWLNPRFTWTYIYEDFMGKVARSCQACTSGTSRPVVASKTVENFWRAKYLRQKRRRDNVVC